MDHYKWNKEKHERFKIERGMSFEQITMHIGRGDVLDIVAHPNQEKYPNQQLLVVEINDYAYLVPFDEQEILESFERGEWKSVQNVKAEIMKHQQYARKTLKKDQRVNIRISSKVLEEIQALAVENGIPYQTLMSSVLHRYVSGYLIEKPRPNE